MPGPPIIGSSWPEMARIESRIASASRRRSGAWERSSLRGSICVALGDGSATPRKARLMTISRRARFTDQPSSMNRPASQSRSSGCVGGVPRRPKLSVVATIPRPKRWCQSRLTMTRARRSLPGPTASSASWSRPLGASTASALAAKGALPNSDSPRRATGAAGRVCWPRMKSAWS